MEKIDFWKKKNRKKMTKLFCSVITFLKLHNFKTINILFVGNDFSRRFERGRFRICNNLILTKLKGGGGVSESSTRKIPT